MDPTLEAFLRSWPLDPWIVAPLLLSAGVYLRGWRQLRRRGAAFFGPAQLAAFLGGLAAVFLALASPIEPFADLLLQVHMIQHLLLMMVAPPLLWLGAPLLPVLRGLPAPIRRHWIAPLFRLPLLREVWRRLTHPAVAWPLFVVTTWLWHVPPLFETALRSAGWHRVEHACFLATGLLFWWPVIQPYPSRPRCSRWVLLPYLILADIANTVLAAVLAFSDRLLYDHYATVPRLWGLPALDDQAAAGVIMWVPGSLAYLVPVVLIGARLLYGRRSPTRQPRRIALPLVGLQGERRPSPPDLLRLPVLGRFLRWRHGRACLQAVMVLMAIAIIGDGLLGPQVAPMNLAGVLPWVHWRGLLVLGLLIGGNFFCLACPFTLPRRLARGFLPGARSWPRLLRSKWLAAALLVLFFWAYEAFGLWASPWWTAWLTIAYFLAAFAIDAWSRGAFCKYVCPIGQFNFVQALVSPLEVKVRDPDICRTCQTRDCIRGRAGIPGCELHLYQPRKAGNMDCTFCLDCVHACPHGNVGMLAGAPGADLLDDPARSGVGRFAHRPDLAALVLVLVAAAFVNAAGMVAPVLDWQDRLGMALGVGRRTVVTVSVLVGLLVLPLLMIGLATVLGRWWSGDRRPWLETAARFAFALVPLGASMWLTHYTFHFLSGAGAIVPVTQRLLGDLGVSWVGEPAWACGCCVAVAPWLLRLELLFLELGLLLSLYVGYRMASDRHGPAALKQFLPWGVLMLLLFAVGVWIVFQPMEMRGTVM